MFNLDIPPLNDAEQDEIVSIFSSSLVQKYLNVLATGIIKDILGGNPGLGQSDSDYIRMEAHYKGGLAVLETLLSIKSTRFIHPNSLTNSINSNYSTK